MKKLILFFIVVFCVQNVQSQEEYQLVKPVYDIPTPKNNANSIFCCGDTNLIFNGDFEAGNTNFLSDFTNDIFVSPNSYTVYDLSSGLIPCRNWGLSDHSTCEGGTNSHVMLVNGATQQAINVNNVIWQTAQPIQVEQDSQYQFCAYMQHLPQCCFDVPPRIKIEVSFSGGTNWTTLLNWTALTAGSTTDLCDWEHIQASFTASAGDVAIRILLDELGDGDGNDLAIDDISLTKKREHPLTFILFNAPSPNPALYHMGAILNAPLPDTSCTFLWTIGQVNDPFDPLNTLMANTIAQGGTHTAGVLNPTWALGTTFDGYGGGTPNGLFSYHNFYLVMLEILDCDCEQDSRSYLVIYNSGIANPVSSPFAAKTLSPEQYHAFSNKIQNTYREEEKSNTPKPVEELVLQAIPNPFFNFLEVYFELPTRDEVTLLLTSMDGKMLLIKKLGELPQGQHKYELNIDELSLGEGVFFLNLKTPQGQITQKLIKINP